LDGENRVFSGAIEVSPSGPFSFDLSAKIFSNGDRQIRIYDEGVFRQVIHLNGKLVLICISDEGTVDSAKLNVKLKSEMKLAESEKEKAREIVTRLFNLDFDPSQLYGAIGGDLTMKNITQKLCGLRSPTTQTVFEALIDSIIEQQISLKIAISIERRMIKKFGQSIEVDGEVYFAYPTPQALSLVPVDDLRGCGLTQRKAEYIKEISELEAAGKIDLERLNLLDDTSKIIAQLDSIRGVGVWTAELTAIRSMRRWDAMPADDVGLRRVISHYYCDGKKITTEQARRIAEAWGKWRGLAAFYLVVAELVNLEI
jgi:DNA-3-methyladenine glycosylase II